MQDILVHATRLEPWSSNIEYGARLASLIQGSVTGAYVYSSPLYTAPPYCSTELLTAIIENAHTMEAAAAAAARPFIAWAESVGAKRASWQVAEGYLPDALAHIGTWHDLLILERNPDSPWGSPPDVASLILAACLPSIVVPSEYAGGVDLDCVALAWNGAPEALRAIHAAIPLLQRARRVVLLTGERRNTYQDITWTPPFDMGVHLERHGIKVHRQELVTEDDVAGEAILEAVKKAGAGLLVMGAYGRSRFSEWALGGATRHVLGHATLPVFMRH
jgi:hypothetical protein